MAPEQARGEPTDARADVFALGGILCALLTGQPPFGGKSKLEVIRRAGAADLAEAIARLDGCGADGELVRLCRRCLSPDPADRPTDGQAVADGLSSYLNGVQERLQAAERERAVAVAREAEQRKRRKVQLALAGAVLGLLLGGGAFAWWRNQEAQAGRERHARNAEAVTALLGQAEAALKAGDAAKAQVALEAAHKRSDEGGAEHEAERLTGLEADLRLVRDLDAVDQFRWTELEKVPNEGAMAMRTREALGRFGADPDAVPVDEATARVSASVVRERIVSALDRLLRHQKTAGVRALLRRVDADPYRDAIRDVVLVNAVSKMRELVGQATALEQPAGFVAFLGESGAIPPEQRRHLLEVALGRRPGDLHLLMTLGRSYPINQQDGLNERLRWLQAAVAAFPAMPATHNSLGVALLDKKDLPAAEAAFRKAIALDRKYAGARLNLGVALSEQGHEDEAIACYRKAIELDPKLAVAHHNLGNALDKKGKLNAAITCWRKAIELDSKHAKSHCILGEGLKRMGQVDEAIVCFNKAIALDPKYVAAHSNLGAILCDVKRDYDGAIACFKKAIALDPKVAVVHNNLGMALYGKGQLDEAIASFKKAIALDPKDAAAHRNLGGILCDGKHDYDGAIACFQKAISLDPKDAVTHFNLGNALRGKGRVDEGIASFKKAIEINPRLAGAHTGLGAILANNGHLDEATACWRKAIALDPKDALAHFNLGRVLKDQGQLDAAIASYKRAIEFDPKYAEAHTFMGLALRDKGQRDEAIRWHRKAIALDPKYAVAHNNLGGALAAKGQLDEAIACYREAIALDPKYAAPHNNLGGALFRKGQCAEAITSCRKAIALDPKYVAAHSNLGAILCDGKHDYDGAIACFQKAIELDPKDAVTHFNLGNALEGKGRADQAIACYSKAIELNPKDAKARVSLGTLLRDKGQVDEAIACFQKAIELDPKYAVAHHNLGNALQGKGRVDAAIACYQKAIALDPNLAGVHYNLGSALAATGQLDAAIASYKRAIELDPKFAEAYCNRRSALSRQGRFAESLAAFKRGHELGTKRPGWPYPSGAWVRQAEKRATMESRLPAFLQGQFQPRGTTELLGLADVCGPKKLHAAATRLYAEAFAADPKLADDLKADHRYNAACYAALAAAGQGEDAAKLDDKEKTRLRKQALDWLRADLAMRSKQLHGSKPADRAAVQQALRHWQQDSDLVGIRDAAALAKLPGAERAVCEQLWADVAALLKEAEAAATLGKP
jgi:tetratricopeptide (TPR) repeat protein